MLVLAILQDQLLKSFSDFQLRLIINLLIHNPSNDFFCRLLPSSLNFWLFLQYFFLQSEIGDLQLGFAYCGLKVNFELIDVLFSAFHHFTERSAYGVNTGFLHFAHLDLIFEFLDLSILIITLFSISLRCLDVFKSWRSFYF